jgi:prepilin signal peptidase PulO-like enzyme (type II secretory pathway)
MTPILIVPILAGWISGWIINYLADTLPVVRRLSRPACNQCHANYPIGSYLLFGRCPACGHKRGWRPLIVQAAMVIISLYIWVNPHTMGYVPGILLLTYFGVVIVIDLEHRLILHPTSIVGALLGLGIGIAVHGFFSTLLGGLGGLVIMLALYYLGVLFSKIRARRMSASGRAADDEEALGAGDVILACVLGFVLGWPLIWFGLLLGILLGGIIGVILVIFFILSGRYGKNALMVFIPYGPFFVLSAFIILFLPNWIVHAVPK